MLPLPSEIITILQEFAPVFSRRVWAAVQVLVIGAILAPGKRTVSAGLRVMGLSQERQFQKYHRVLNRARWSSRRLSQILLKVLIDTFVPADAPLVMGLDETIERRKGEKIAAKGIYRDGVRSSHSHFVKASGLRWVSLMLLGTIPWAQRVWALPFLTVLAPSERYFEQRGLRSKKMTDWARQMLLQVRRWVPERHLVVVADRSYAAIELLSRCAQRHHPITMLTRLRLDAALYDPAPPYQGRGRPRKKGKRQVTLAHRLTSSQTCWCPLKVGWYGHHARQVEVASDTAVWYHTGLSPVSIRWVLIRDPLGHFPSQALLSTDLTLTPSQILTWFVQRWQLEVTFAEVRAHLGVETQRQWSDLAIARTTPVLLALFSLVTLMAHRLLHDQPLPPRQTAWYAKQTATFSDTLAFVRQHLWTPTLFSISPPHPDIVKIPRLVLNHLTALLAFAA